jgi:hypothetical protein
VGGDDFILTSYIRKKMQNNSIAPISDIIEKPGISKVSSLTVSVSSGTGFITDSIRIDVFFLFITEYMFPARSRTLCKMIMVLISLCAHAAICVALIF